MSTQPSGTPRGSDVFWGAVKLLFWIVAGAALVALPWLVEWTDWRLWASSGVGVLLLVYAAREGKAWRKLYRLWRHGPEGNPDEAFGPIDPNQFIKLLGRRGRIKRYLRKTFGGRIDVKPVFRAAALELWHNMADIDNYLHARDPKDKRSIDADEWFRRIAHNFARDYAERSGNLANTVQGVFLEFVSSRLGFWDRLGLASDQRLSQLVPEFHRAVESLPPKLAPILEGDLNMNLIVAAERRFAQFDPRRDQAIKMLRDSLGLDHG
jgi:hypothetical protein